MRGRKPKPIALRIAQGNPGKRPIPADLDLPTGASSAPAHLCVEAKREWRRVSRMLEQAGLLRHTDRAALAAYCGAYARWVAAEKLLRRGRLVLTGDDGKVYAHPAVKIASDAMKLMLQYLTRFGLSPVDRVRLAGPTAAQKKPGAELQEFIGDAPPLRLAQ